jgi:hypothetical protein
MLITATVFFLFLFVRLVRHVIDPMEPNPPLEQICPDNLSTLVIIR